jgi:hypothetical protein
MRSSNRLYYNYITRFESPSRFDWTKLKSRSQEKGDEPHRRRRGKKRHTKKMSLILLVESLKCDMINNFVSYSIHLGFESFNSSSSRFVCLCFSRLFEAPASLSIIALITSFGTHRRARNCQGKRIPRSGPSTMIPSPR